MLREIFELGAPILIDASTSHKPSKSERVCAMMYLQIVNFFLF